MKNKQIKYIVLVLLAGVTGFVIYSQEFSERLQTPEARARLRALRLWQQAHPEAQPVSEQIKGKVAEYISWIRKKIFGQILGPSQSQGYLSIITLEAAIEQINRSTRGTGITTEQIEELKPLITELIGKEKRYPNDFVFYHGMNKDIMIALDMLKRLYDLSTGREVKKFEFLRVPTALVPSQTPEQFIEKYKLQLEGEFDHAPEIKQQLLSTNLALPGNLIAGESTLYYFSKSISNTNMNAIISKVVDFVFDNSSASTNYIEVVKQLMFLKVAKLQQVLDANHYGLLLQIFIPRNLADKTVYISEKYGIPKEGIYKFKANLLLETLQKNPALLKNELQNLQARIILNKELFSRPGIITIYRHHLMPPEAYNVWYLPSVSGITDELLLIRLEQIPTKTFLIAFFPLIQEALYGGNDRARQSAIFLCKELIEQGQTMEQILQLAIDLIRSKGITTKGVLARVSGETLLSVLVRNGYGIEETLQIANEFIKDVGYSQAIALSLFDELVKKGIKVPEAMDLTIEFLKSDDSVIQDRAVTLFEILVKKGGEIPKAIAIATELVNVNHTVTQYRALELFMILVQEGYAIPESLQIATKLINIKDILLPNRARNILEVLIKKKAEIPKIINVTVELTKSDESSKQSQAQELFIVLVKEGYAIPEAIQTVTRLANSKDKFTQIRALDLLVVLVEEGHAFQQAFEIILQLLKTTDTHTQDKLLDLLMVLVKNNDRIPLSMTMRIDYVDAAMRLLESESIPVQLRVIDLFTLLVENGHGAAISQAIEVAKWALAYIHPYKRIAADYHKKGEELMEAIREHKRKTGGAKL